MLALPYNIEEEPGNNYSSMGGWQFMHTKVCVAACERRSNAPCRCTGKAAAA